MAAWEVSVGFLGKLMELAVDRSSSQDIPEHLTVEHGQQTAESRSSGIFWGEVLAAMALFSVCGTGMALDLQATGHELIGLRKTVQLDDGRKIIFTKVNAMWVGNIHAGCHRKDMDRRAVVERYRLPLDSELYGGAIENKWGDIETHFCWMQSGKIYYILWSNGSVTQYTIK